VDRARHRLKGVFKAAFCQWKREVRRGGRSERYRYRSILFRPREVAAPAPRTMATTVVSAMGHDVMTANKERCASNTVRLSTVLQQSCNDEGFAVSFVVLILRRERHSRHGNAGAGISLAL